MPTLRLFVAVDPAPAVRVALRAAIARVRPLAPRARWVAPGVSHVTLAFLGDTAAETVPALVLALGAAARGLTPIDARFAGAGTFGGASPRVLWVGLTEGAAALGAVHRALCAALAPLGFTPERAALTPHLTLARAGGRGGEPALALCAEALAGEDFGVTHLDAMVLYESAQGPAGSTYTALATLPFGG